MPKEGTPPERHSLPSLALWAGCRIMNMNTSTFAWLRLIAAIGLTVGALPYTWARSLVTWMLVGQTDVLHLGLFVGSLVAVALLAHNLAPVLPPAIRKLVLPTVLLVCAAEYAALVWFKVSDLSPRPGLFLILCASTFWVPWTAWLFFGYPGWRLRLGMQALFVAAAPAFPLLIRAEGLTGDSLAVFSWRRDQSEAHAPVFGALQPQTDGGGVDLTRTTPHDFPQFLGPHRSAMLPGVRLARSWSTAPPRQVWRRPVGAGWSAFAVIGDYALTQEQRGPEECVTCYRLSDGAPVWVHADPIRFDSSLGGPGPRATPTIAGGRVYTVGATGLLNCLEGSTGRRVWSVNILEDNGGADISHGVCASPLVTDDLVIVCPTGKEGVSLVAYQRETGQRVWRGGESKASYGSPFLAELGGVRQVLLHNAAGVAGHDPATGQVLWSFPWTNSDEINCAMPIPNAGGPGRIFASTGYNKGSTLWQIERAADGSWEPREVWQSRRMKTKFTTPVLYNGYIYGLDDGYLACIEAKTGKEKWRERRFRYKHGQVLLAGDLLLIQAEDGDVCLVEPTPEAHRELASFPALEGKTWNNPALAGRYLLVRNDREAACFELSLETEK